MSLKDLTAAVTQANREMHAHRRSWAEMLIETNDVDGARRVLQLAVHDDAIRVTKVDLDLIKPDLGERYTAWVCASVCECALDLQPQHPLRMTFLALVRAGMTVLLDGSFIHELVATAEHHAYARRVRAAAIELMRREDDGHAG